MARVYQDVGWCPICDKETQQKFDDSEHERDSSNDRRECLECHATWSGLTGVWRPAVSENFTAMTADQWQALDDLILLETRRP